MKEKKLYLTKPVSEKIWNYVGDPLHPNTTFDVGLIDNVERSEIRVDEFGAYITRFVE